MMTTVVDVCLIDGSPLIQHHEPDDCDGHVMWRHWFECEAQGHYYHAEHDGLGEYVPTDEEWEERSTA